jgi:hypothetical protein
MRSVLPALFLTLSLQAAPRDLIIVAGQSNAVGFDAYASELPADDADKDVLFWWRVGDPPPDQHDVTSGGEWSHLQAQMKGSPLLTPSPEEKKAHPRQYGNFAKAEGGFGPEIGLTRALRAKEGKPLAIIKAAFSGTAVADDWNPDDPGIKGSCYRALVTEVKAAMASAKTEGIELNFRALVWVQGESDATAAHAKDYEKNLGHMISRLRADLSVPELRALIGVNTRFGNGKNPHMPVVIVAQKALADKDPLTTYVDTAGAETLPPSHTHFTAKGTLEIGQRFAHALTEPEPIYTALFNGRDLSGWDGDPKLWKVENGVIVGNNPSPEAMKGNSFLIWRGGTLKDFELRATVRVIGDNNSGLQYRSREMKHIAPWVITGYQCDIHPALEHTGMTYEEKGRGIFGLNGKNVLLDPEGALWELSEHTPIKADLSQWNEFTITARGFHFIHQLNGQTTSELIDHNASKRAREGLLAIQLHSGNANRVEIKSISLRALLDASVVPFDATQLPNTARKIEKPRTQRPQGTGPIAPRQK